MRYEEVYVNWCPHQNDNVPRMRQWAPTFSKETTFLAPRRDASLGTRWEKTPYQEGLDNTLAHWWRKDDFGKQI